MKKSPSPYGDRKVVLSTLNPQNGFKVMSKNPTGITSGDVYAQTYAVNAMHFTRDEWIHEHGPESVKHRMEGWLANAAADPYNSRVSEVVFDRIERSNHAESLSPLGRQNYGITEDDILTFAEVEELFWTHYPTDVLLEK